MSDGQSAETIVGRGAKEGAELFRDWFHDLTLAPERGEQSAYVFVMGSLAEVLRVFDFHTVFPEINSLQTAVRRLCDARRDHPNAEAGLWRISRTSEAMNVTSL